MHETGPEARNSRARLIAVGAFATLALCAAACGERAGTSTSKEAAPPPVAGRISAAAPGSAADSDVAAHGNGVPAGYTILLDHADAKASDVSYKPAEAGRWQVTTGPAHILYSARDTAHKKYSATATFEQLAAPAHPEAFGVFIGGSALNGTGIKYTYFIVRGDGKYSVKVRDGANARTLTDWTAHPAIPRQDAAGKALYGIRIDVDRGEAKVSVNGSPVTTISGKQAPIDGIAGVRVNHNLNLTVTPVSIVR